MPDLKNKTILVTGAASGIGRAAAVCCARGGAKIIAVDLDTAGIDALAAEFPDNTIGHSVDVQDASSVAALFTQITQSTNHLDGVIHAAGILEGALTPVDEFEELTWDRVIEINLKGSFLISKHAVPMLEKSDDAVLILISSGAGVKGGSSSVAYGSSKGGVHGLSLVLAAQLAARNIRVHAVCPGALATPLKLRQVQKSADQSGQSMDELTARLGDPEGVGKILAFLVSDDADYLRGTIFTR
jgi:NAD(P)-dependent dehydrogenase (short-subunit alcohol dehydrogenase family)